MIGRIDEGNEVSGAGLISAEQLLQLGDRADRCELVDGELQMMSPAGGVHGRVAAQIAWLLENHARQGNLGVVFAAETGFRISRDPDTVLAPDVAFVCRQRFAGIENEVRYPDLVPDLVVKVISPSDTFSHVETKALRWLSAGCSLVLVADPTHETVHRYRSRSDISVLRGEEAVDCDCGVALWRPQASEFFRR